jgi:hypothetical protein
MYLNGIGNITIHMNVPKNYEFRTNVGRLRLLFYMHFHPHPGDGIGALKCYWKCHDLTQRPSLVLKTTYKNITCT